MSRSEPMKCSRQTGLGLPAALFVIVVLALIAVAITELERTSAESFSFNVLSQRAFYAAESGAQVGLNRLFPPGGAASDCTNAYFGTSQTYTQGGLNGCSVTVACRADTVGADTIFTLTATGQCGTGSDSAIRVIEVRAR